MSKNQKITICVSCGYDENGKQRRRKRSVEVPKTVRGEKQLENFRKKQEYALRCELNAEIEEEEERLSGELTFSEYARRDRAIKLADNTIRSTTVESDKSLLAYFDNMIGKKKISEITVSDVRTVKATIASKRTDKGTGEFVSDKTKYNYFSFFRSIMKSAYNEDMIAENPCLKVKNFGYDKGHQNYLCRAEIVELLKGIEPMPIAIQMRVLLPLLTGARRGEFLALRWEDYKEDEYGGKYLSINKGIYYTKATGIILSKPKTRESNRDIPCEYLLGEKLKEYKEWQDEYAGKLGNMWADKGFILTDDFGNPLSPDSYSEKLRKIMEQVGVKASSHTFRRTYASVLNKNGSTIKEIANILGHTNPELTNSIYIQTFKDTPKIDNFSGFMREIGV